MQRNTACGVRGLPSKLSNHKKGGSRVLSQTVFCEQVRACERAMYVTAFSVVQNDADAAEVISESVCRAFARLDTLQKDSAFCAWILRIVHNTAVELVRKNNRQVPVDVLPEAADAAQDECETVDRIALQSAVNALRQPYRTVILLYYYESLSVAEIAETTETSPVAVRAQLSRARKMLRAALKEDDFDA